MSRKTAFMQLEQDLGRVLRIGAMIAIGITAACLVEWLFRTIG